MTADEFADAVKALDNACPPRVPAQWDTRPPSYSILTPSGRFPVDEAVFRDLMRLRQNCDHWQQAATHWRASSIEEQLKAKKLRAKLRALRKAGA